MKSIKQEVLKELDKPVIWKGTRTSIAIDLTLKRVEEVIDKVEKDWRGDGISKLMSDTILVFSSNIKRKLGIKQTQTKEEKQ